ncbi:mechanosensitive ion channel [Acidithiobacillus sp. YTS05]|uniref:mechanosensitive ion channel family protein n=1 Tax=Igneacidithiobacillus copahuensis TaxID=2724909 RepID=UPI001D007AB6|nr:mechanosensitive ion channel domain-containing protein [Igneacidithiobacillus copahuensis]UTV82271.1 mechanosensitive ion channel [Acidithiobacillus sp. YTS05]
MTSEKLSQSLLRVCLGLLLACGLLSSLASASPTSDFAGDASVLHHIHDSLNGSVSLQQLRQWQRQTQAVVASANACTQRQQASLNTIEKSLHILGHPVAGEPAELGQLRQKLETQQKQVNGKLAACKVLYVGGNTVLGELHAKQTRIHTRELLQRGPDFIQQISQIVSTPKKTWEQERDFWIRWNAIAIFNDPNFQGAWGIGIAVYLVAMILRRNSRSAIRELYPLLAIIAWLLASVLLGVLLPITELVLTTLSAYILSTWLARSMLRHLAEIPNRAQREAVLLRVLWRPLRFIITFGVFVVMYQSLDPQGSNIIAEHTALLTVIHTAILSSIIWMLWRARRFTFLKNWRWLQVLLFGLATVLILLNFIGFSQLANYLTDGFVTTLVAVIVARVVAWFIDDIWGEDDDEDNGALPRLLRQHLGFTTQGSSWLYWLRILIHASLWMLVLAISLLAWGLTHSSFHYFWQYFIQGFSVGNFHIQPFRWLIAIFLLIVLFNVNQWIQSRLASARGIFRHFDIGSRHSVLAIFRYVGFIIAILLSLSTAGVALHNLAIIAGALSVGIGFGLQNIVNNFVSGIILLLERPIRVGDWVRVGTTEGYVQRLSIRSTLILTFDRTEVFVPNSELISGQVTNWTYSNNVLRLMIPLRVRHDSDIDEVREILEEVGQNHPDVLQDDPRGIPPTALLLDVTENSLVFYLRVYIGDCNNSFTIQTELRARAVEALYRRGIRLAHQQQDLYFPERAPAAEHDSSAQV